VIDVALSAQAVGENGGHADRDSGATPLRWKGDENLTASDPNEINSLWEGEFSAGMLVGDGTVWEGDYGI
jgi:hypothetical protein